MVLLYANCCNVTSMFSWIVLSALVSGIFTRRHLWVSLIREAVCSWGFRHQSKGRENNLDMICYRGRTWIMTAERHISHALMVGLTSSGWFSRPLNCSLFERTHIRTESPGVLRRFCSVLGQSCAPYSPHCYHAINNCSSYSYTNAVVPIDYRCYYGPIDYRFGYALIKEPRLH